MRWKDCSSYPVALGLLAAAACGDMKADLVRPTEIVGTWVQRRPDGSWGDTVTYLADGRIEGSVGGRAAGASERWVVVRSRTAGDGICVGDQMKPTCQPYRLSGDTLTRGPFEEPTTFRRVR